MNQFVNNLKSSFSRGNNLTKLLYVNIGIYVVLALVTIVFRLFNADARLFTSYLELPAYFPALVLKPWSLVTYMFMHAGFFHLFFNMLCLYWFGQIFVNFFSQKQLVGLYLLGGLGGALFFILSYNLFPLFASTLPYQTLVGASASIMAIIVATAVKAPNYTIRLLLIGEVKLKYVAIFTVLMSMLSTASDNAGGEFAHLGGALLGYLYAISLNNGRDILRPLNRCIDWCTNLFHKPIRKKSKIKVSNFKHSASDAEYNQQQAMSNRELDAILDKVKKSGYASLTADEKKKLFDKSQSL